LIGRLVPGVGTFVSLPAGFGGMPIPKFIVYTALGTAVRNGTFIGLGWALGARWTLVQQYSPVLQYAALAAGLVAIIWFLWRRWGRRR
jgi:membrane protein DedA with SNARE-associated domain